MPIVGGGEVMQQLKNKWKKLRKLLDQEEMAVEYLEFMEALIEKIEEIDLSLGYVLKKGKSNEEEA